MYSNNRLDESSLKVIENQLAYEAMMNRKYNLYAAYFNDAQLKNLCQKSSNKHKENYNNLLNYLISYH